MNTTATATAAAVARTASAIRWTEGPNSSLKSGDFTIRPARLGFQWELWRRTPGIGDEALGCGELEMLQARAAHFSRFAPAPQPELKRRTMARNPEPKHGLARAWEWLTH